MIYRYQAYSLNIQSELIFPELAVSSLEHDADVLIRWGKINPQGLSGATFSGLTYQISDGLFWLFVPHVAYFLVINGREIVVEPLIHAEEDSIRAFLLEACLSILLMQRAMFVVRACVIQFGTSAIAFVGDYGLGHSTLLVDFIQAGYSILSDDVCAIDSSGYVWPSFPEVRLWPDALSHFGDSVLPYRALRPSIDKVSLPIRSSFQSKRLPLRAMYHLNINAANINRLTPLYSVQKIQCIEKYIHKKYLVDAMGIKRNYFKQVVAIAQQIIMADIACAVDKFRLHEWVDVVKNDLTVRCAEHAHA